MRITKRVLDEVKAVSRERQRGLPDHQYHCPDCGSVLQVFNGELDLVRRLDAVKPLTCSCDEWHCGICHPTLPPSAEAKS